MNLYRAAILRGWWLILLVVLAAAAYLGTWLPKLHVDAGTNVLLNEDDEDLAYYNSTRPDWGYDEYAIFCVTIHWCILRMQSNFCSQASRCLSL